MQGQPSKPPVATNCPRHFIAPSHNFSLRIVAYNRQIITPIPIMTSNAARQMVIDVIPPHSLAKSLTFVSRSIIHNSVPAISAQFSAVRARLGAVWWAPPTSVLYLLHACLSLLTTHEVGGRNILCPLRSDARDFVLGGLATGLVLTLTAHRSLLALRFFCTWAISRGGRAAHRIRRWILVHGSGRPPMDHVSSTQTVAESSPAAQTPQTLIWTRGKRVKSLFFFCCREHTKPVGNRR
jgi:hypothetical protein